jgi:hypothetical protein
LESIFVTFPNPFHIPQAAELIVGLLNTFQSCNTMLSGVVNPTLLKKLKEDDGGIGTIEHLDLSNGTVGSSELSLLTKAMVSC